MKINCLKCAIVLYSLLMTFSCYAQFGARTQLDLVNSSVLTNEIISHDFDNNGFNDIAIAKNGSNEGISLYMNQGDNNFTIVHFDDIEITSFTYLDAGDLNNDGWIDIVATGPLINDSLVYVFYNDEGAFSSYQIINMTPLPYPAGIKITDVDDDGVKEILALGDVNFRIYNNIGSTTWAITELPVLAEYYGFELSDIDNDGDEDVLIASLELFIFMNVNGALMYDAARSATILPEDNLVLLEVHLDDLDNDGDEDLLINGNSNSDFRWYENLGNGFFNSLPNVFDTNSRSKSFATADFDNDGDTDIFTVIPQLAIAVWYENLGGGDFGPRTLVFQNDIITIRTTNTNDLNNDGLPDIIWSGLLSFHLNESSLSIDEEELALNTFTIYPNPSKSTFNLKSNESGKISIYNNLGSLVFTKPIHKGLNRITHNLALGYYIIVFKNEYNLETIVSKIIVR